MNQFEKLSEGNYGERFGQAVEKLGKYVKVYGKILDYVDDVLDAVKSGDLDADSPEATHALLSSDEIDEIYNNHNKLKDLADHITKFKNGTISPEEFMSSIEEMEYLLKKDEEMIENVLKWNHLSLENLGFDSRILSTQEYNSNQQYNPPPQYNPNQQYNAASKNSGCLGVIAVMIIILCILI